MNSKDILTPQQLAKRLQVGVDWVYEKCRSRGSHGQAPLPVLRVGRYLRFYWPDICCWMRGQPLTSETLITAVTEHILKGEHNGTTAEGLSVAQGA
jgi:hypothetical protein